MRYRGTSGEDHLCQLPRYQRQHLLCGFQCFVFFFFPCRFCASVPYRHCFHHSQRISISKTCPQLLVFILSLSHCSFFSRFFVALLHLMFLLLLFLPFCFQSFLQCNHEIVLNGDQRSRELRPASCSPEESRKEAVQSSLRGTRIRMDTDGRETEEWWFNVRPKRVGKRRPCPIDEFLSESFESSSTSDATTARWYEPH